MKTITDISPYIGIEEEFKKYLMSGKDYLYYFNINQIIINDNYNIPLYTSFYSKHKNMSMIFLGNSINNIEDFCFLTIDHNANIENEQTKKIQFLEKKDIKINKQLFSNYVNSISLTEIWYEATLNGPFDIINNSQIKTHKIKYVNKGYNPQLLKDIINEKC